MESGPARAEWVGEIEEEVVPTKTNDGSICRCYEYLACTCVGKETAAAPEVSFRELVRSAPEIGMTTKDFLRLLCNKVGAFADDVLKWLRGVTPDDLARTVILCAVEGILRQHKITPAVSLL